MGPGAGTGLAVDTTLVSHEIQKVLDHPRLRSHVSRASYLHDNGFIKIPVADLSHGGVLRVHKWQGEGLTRPTIHSHMWDFASLLISGQMTTTCYEESPDGLEMTRAIYSDGELRSDGTIRLAPIFSSVLKLGSYTTVSYRAMHRVEACRGTISIVARSARRSEFAVVAQEPGQALGRELREPVDEQEVTAILRAALDSIPKLGRS